MVIYTTRDQYELWFREEYLSLIQGKELTTAVRPGDRTYPNPKWVNKNEIVKVRIIKKPGNEEKGIEPEFHEFDTLAKIVDIDVKKIQDVTHTDLKNSSYDCLTKEDMKKHLQKIYLREFNDSDLVTLLKLNYI